MKLEANLRLQIASKQWNIDLQDKPCKKPCTNFIHVEKDIN